MKPEHIFALITLATMLYSVWMIRTQQRTIDRLTDKLMARDYGEYKRHDKTLMREESRIRKPQSFYDDSSVETDEVQ